MGPGTAPVCKSILLGFEDDVADTCALRFDAAGADSSKIIVMTGVRMRNETGKLVERSFTLAHVAQLRDAIERERPGLIVIDPVSCAMPEGKDSNNNSDTRGLLSEIAKLAGEFGVAIIMVTHRPKSGHGGKAVFAAMGSLAFLAAARSAWMIAPDPQDDQRQFFVLKNNLGPDGNNLAFRVVGPVPHIEWDGAVSVSADDVLKADGDSTPGPDPEKRNEATGWLQGRACRP